MRKWTWVVLLLGTLCLGCSACTSTGKTDLLRILTSGRDGWQHPERVIESLALQPGDRVAEIGAGAGYWLPWLAAAVGPSGRVYAVEVDAELIAELHELIRRESLDNVEVVYGEYADPLLPDGSIDLAMTSNTYHHFEDRSDYFARLKKDLSARGRVAHIDNRDDLPIPFRWLGTSGHWSNVDDMSAEMSAAGYRRVETFDFLLQSFQIFAPLDSVAGG